MQVVERLGTLINDDLEFFKLFKNGAHIDDDADTDYRPQASLSQGTNLLREMQSKPQPFIVNICGKRREF